MMDYGEGCDWKFLEIILLLLEQISGEYLLKEMLVECNIRLITENKNDNVFSY